MRDGEGGRKREGDSAGGREVDDDGGGDAGNTRTRDARHEDASLAAQPAVDAVTDAVLQLPPTQRAVVVLHHFEGLPYTEIAKLTGSSVPAVRSHLFRARRTLAQTLQSWGSHR